jgi:hypothetical protein
MAKYDVLVDNVSGTTRVEAEGFALEGGMLVFHAAGANVAAFKQWLTVTSYVETQAPVE